MVKKKTRSSRPPRRKSSLPTKPVVPEPLKELVQAAESGKLVPLIGAGISRQATADDGRTKLPTWRELIENLATETERLGHLNTLERGQITSLLDRGKYLIVAETLRQRIGEEAYEDFLVRTFELDLTPAPIHKALRKLKVPLILTTNYDYLLEDTYDPARGRSRARTQNEASLVQDDIQNWKMDKPPAIFKIHGSIQQPKTVVLTESDYRDLLYRQPDYRTILTAILVTHTVLMLGFSFDDPELVQLFGFMRDAFKYKSRGHYILMPSDKLVKLEQEYNLKQFGVKTIPYDNTSGDHSEVLAFMNRLIFTAYSTSRRTTKPGLIKSVTPRY